MINKAGSSSEYYSLKSLFEEVLGRNSYRRVKEYASLADWRRECVRLVRAISVSIDATVDVADTEWREEIQTEIEHGIQRLKAADQFDSLFAGLCATLGRVAFRQLGLLPAGHRSLESVPLKAGNWRLDLFRTVQYVQTPTQRQAQVEATRRRRRGSVKSAE